MTSIRDLLAALPASAAARPRLTWYGAGQERVELSGRVLANWVVKATNLLVEEADAGPGVRVRLDLPAHWRTVVWAAATWNAGGEARLARVDPDDVTGTGPPAPGEDDVAAVVTDRPAEAQQDAGRAGAVVIAVALPALALRFAGPTAPGALDGAADLMTYADTLGWAPPLEPAAPALDGRVTHGALLAWARTTAGAAPWPAGARVLIDTRLGVAPVLAAAVAAWAVDGSLVLLGDPTADAAAISTAERVEVTVRG